MPRYEIFIETIPGEFESMGVIFDVPNLEEAKAETWRMIGNGVFRYEELPELQEAPVEPVVEPVVEPEAPKSRAKKAEPVVEPEAVEPEAEPVAPTE